jgi:predicted ATPase
MTGLALALGFNSRSTLLDYQEKDRFSDTITRAKAKVEQYAEERLFDKDGANGAKFSLANNFKRWKEKQEIEGNLKNTVTINVELVDDDDE